jgi:Nucleotidyl transferase AbiEii toxin, Type IV TA system
MASVSRAATSLGSDVGDKLVAIHEALDAASTPHAFGGAIALAYAVPDPRATNDIDINISVSVDEAERVIKALPGAITARPDVLATIRADGQDRLRWGDVPIDVFFPQHEFHAIVQARATVQPFRTITIPVITATDLTVFKTMFDRAKDWPDIEAMLRAQAVDEAEALRWVETILGADHPCYSRLADLIEDIHAHPGEQPDVAPNVWKRIGPGA